MLRSQIPQASNRISNVGQQVLVFREKQKNQMRLFTIINLDGKNVYMEDEKGKKIQSVKSLNLQI